MPDLQRYLRRFRRLLAPPGRAGPMAVLDRAAALAAEAHVAVTTELLEGDPLRAILGRARDWSPDLVLIGRTSRSGPGSPMVGSLAMHLVEFTQWPVVIVPEVGPVGS